MHEIIFYEDIHGNKPVLDYIRSLSENNSKENRIKLHKVQDYINILQAYGTTMGEPYMKHIENEIWELRPVSDRILFAGFINGSYVLLHHFTKKTQKTPRQEIEKARREFNDFKQRSGLL